MKLFDFLKRNPEKTPDKATPIVEYLDMEQTLKRTKERFKCVTAVLERHDKPCKYEFHTTSKGVPVLLCMDATGTEIELYNLNSNPEAECRLKLKSETDGDTSKIVHITGGMRMGHGRLAIERLVQYSREQRKSTVACEFMAPSTETAQIFHTFFSKLGFAVSNTERNIWVAQFHVETPKNVP